MVITLLQHIA